MILALSARFNCIFNFFDLIFKPGLDKGNLWPSSSVKNKMKMNHSDAFKALQTTVSPFLRLNTSYCSKLLCFGSEQCPDVKNPVMGPLKRMELSSCMRNFLRPTVCGPKSQAVWCSMPGRSESCVQAVPARSINTGLENRSEG
jgi:hypothetical protein